MIPAETKGRLQEKLRGVVRRFACACSVIAGIAASGSWAVPGWAVGLGPVVQQSELGRSLRIVIPVLLSPGEEIAAECFKLASVDREGDGVPQQLFGRVSLERTSAGSQLVITNARPVNDPALRVTVQAGCENAIRREYVLLMDPPPIEAPLVAAESVTPGGVAEAAPPPQVLPTARPPARATAREGAGAAPRASVDTARPAKKSAPAKSAPAARVTPKRPARAAEAPRLKISSAAPAGSAAATTQSATEAEQIRAQQELSNAIEAETVVLRQRIVELTALVDRMQQEVRANEVAQRAAEEVAKAAPPPKAIPWWEGSWWNANWPLFAAIIVLPVLLAAGLLWRRRSQGDERADWQAAGGAAIRAEPAVKPSDPTVLAHPAADLATITAIAPPPAPRKAVRRPVPRDGADALAVSELLHVTEEARVYVALGHPERAIDVLNEHIRQVPRSMPAAWLMLLDLYHVSGRRQDFRRLAEEFHLHCNVQAPLWEGFRAAEVDEGGLETFPHILRQVVAMWRQPPCREYLEGLLYDNREGRRMGFPFAAYSDILLLLQILDAPPVIDIDSDLARTGALDPRPAATPPQQPLPLEQDIDRETRDRATKPIR
ncbi:MAG: hypothetical protein ABI724_00150 [Betaproteobacteria bacterium]